MTSSKGNLSKINEQDAKLVDKKSGEDWVEKAAKKYGGKKETDTDVYHVKSVNVEELMIADMTEKLNIVGPMGENNGREDGPRHNPVHGGDEKVMVKENVKAKPVAKT